MNQDDHDPFEDNLSKIAQDFKYPPTPKIAGNVRAKLDSARPQGLQLWKPAIAILLLALLVGLSVPAVRARVADFFQIGIVRIFPMPATATPVEPQSTPLPTPVITPLLKFEGKTTLENARTKVSFPILLPAYPADLGLPDMVYYQDKAGMVVMVWLNPADPQKVRMSLHEIGPSSVVLKKMDPQVVQETSVDGHYALWTTGPYMVEVISGDDDYGFLRLVEGHTLIWAMEDITYRLETDLSLEEAVKIAESLR
jgi:hypothetical protein